MSKIHVDTSDNHGPDLMERTDSVSSIDKELDWLIETEKDDTPQNKEEHYSRSESQREASQQDSLGPHQDQQGQDIRHDEQEEDNLLEEQKLLELEIQKLKAEGFLPMDDPPEYDIADRVRQLNEQLKEEGDTPERTDRKVTFNENVFSVDFPDNFYSDDENDSEPGKNVNTNNENADSSQTQSSEITDPNDLEVARISLQNNGEKSEIKSTKSKHYGESSSKGNAQSKKGQDDKILIERDGKFELISVKGLSAVEKRSMGLEGSPVQDNVDQPDPVSPNGHGDAPGQDTTPDQQTEAILDPKPPPRPRPRPSTATDNTGLWRSQLPPRRIQSARTQRDSQGTSWSMTYTGHSTYGLTQEQKEHKREQIRLKMQRQHEERQAKEEEQRKRQEEAKSAFQAWLQQKKEMENQRKHTEKHQKKQEEEKKEQAETKENFEGWLQMKQEQAKREHKLKKQAEQEKVNGYFMRDRKECNQAFKQWVKSKNEQLRKDRSLKRANANVSRQLAQQSRKSKNLAKALETAQIYRYTDWYGYRF